MSTKNRAWRILLPTHHSLSNPSSNAHRFPGKMGGSTAGRLPQHGAPALSIVSFFFFFFSGQPLPCHSHPPPLTSTVLFRHSFSSRCQSRRRRRRLCLHRCGPGAGGFYPWGGWSWSSSSSLSASLARCLFDLFFDVYVWVYWLISVLGDGLVFVVFLSSSCYWLCFCNFILNVNFFFFGKICLEYVREPLYYWVWFFFLIKFVPLIRIDRATLGFAVTIFHKFGIWFLLFIFRFRIVIIYR